ncbi:cell wall-binding repeat-containing protein [Clostridium sp. CCUG 7971]|uniref:cell wall-binding repeat-containing protein n=1 Tax=Clostridium sp. CCUG 7971 TaxID=2811414 RepID=UPI001ABA6920|nr:cell wall-binding repeat-containing protein [Clostridium sp. CCUG 7971]MBO3443034.1 cell wall-binding repeat-containing protein [Clostridium sp. CCUG 7971]
MIKKTISAVSLSLLIFTSSTLNIFADSNYKKELIEGKTREISMKLNKSAFKKADEAILINEKSLVDGISATPLAYAKDAPIITTEWKKIDKKTIDYIKDLGVKKITIIGGLKAVSKTSEKKLTDMGIEVERISGTNRFETATEIASELNKINNVSEIYLINSRAGLENALSIYDKAAKQNTPILWFNDGDFKDTKFFIRKYKIKKVYVVGDSEKFVYEVENSKAKIKADIEVVKDINKFDTNIDTIKELHKGDIKKLYTASVEYGNRSNALEYISLGGVAAKQNIPILITSDSFTHPQEKFIEKSNVEEIIQVGSEVSKYSIFNTLMSKNFISAMILIVLLVIIVVRAFKYQS